MEKNYSIAIDGPAGVGKTTLAKTIAGRLDFLYVDTGAIYRTLAIFFLDRGILPEDKQGIEALLPKASIDIRYIDSSQHMILNGSDVTDRLRTPEVSHMASVSSSYPAVRTYLLDMQRELAATRNVVMDGRDIGTVVLPTADLKIFLTASPLVRAKRRYLEMQQNGSLGEKTFEELLDEQKERDYRDSHRSIAPLKAAPDAVTIDSSELSAAEVADKVTALMLKKMQNDSQPACMR